MISVIALALFALLHPPLFPQQTVPGLTISHLTGDFYVYTTYQLINGAPFPSNSMYVVTRDGVVMIDTPWNAEETGPLLDSIERRHHKGVVMCIVTHFHADRTAGLDVLKKKGIATYSTMRTWTLAHARNEREAAQHILHDTTFKVGGVPFRTYYPGKGHTADNIVVWFPGARVLYGGCMVKSSEAAGMGNTADADLTRWPSSIRNVIRTFANPRFIIPGHQSWAGTKALKHTLALLKDARAR
jgi:metallo-beta-lactamase class B